MLQLVLRTTPHPAVSAFSSSQCVNYHFEVSEDKVRRRKKIADEHDANRLLALA